MTSAVTMKSGAHMISIVSRANVAPSVWDPHCYRPNHLGQALGEHLSVVRLKRAGYTTALTPFAPIEYRSIPAGGYLTFVLEPRREVADAGCAVVGEQQLVFGTLRAYLGNLLVTPKAEWLGLSSPLFFAVKSEFVGLQPNDSCTYYWWAYLQSPSFLGSLPLGAGGTRPRLDIKALLETPVRVHKLRARQRIHRALADCAEHEWQDYNQRTKIVQAVHGAGESDGRHLARRP